MGMHASGDRKYLEGHGDCKSTKCLFGKDDDSKHQARMEEYSHWFSSQGLVLMDCSDAILCNDIIFTFKHEGCAATSHTHQMSYDGLRVVKTRLRINEDGGSEFYSAMQSFNMLICPGCYDHYTGHQYTPKTPEWYRKYAIAEAGSPGGFLLTMPEAINPLFATKYPDLDLIALDLDNLDRDTSGMTVDCPEHGRFTTGPYCLAAAAIHPCPDSSHADILSLASVAKLSEEEGKMLPNAIHVPTGHRQTLSLRLRHRVAFIDVGYDLQRGPYGSLESLKDCAITMPAGTYVITPGEAFTDKLEEIFGAQEWWVVTYNKGGNDELYFDLLARGTSIQYRYWNFFRETVMLYIQPYVVSCKLWVLYASFTGKSPANVAWHVSKDDAEALRDLVLSFCDFPLTQWKEQPVKAESTTKTKLVIPIKKSFFSKRKTLQQ